MSVVRARYVFDEKTGKMVQVAANLRQPSRGTLIMGDLPDYVSPVTGLVVHGRAGRREDLKRTNSRPWEGRAMEEKYAAKARDEQARKMDHAVGETAREVYQQLPPRKRRLLEGS